MAFRAGPRNLITDVAGLLVGNASDAILKSGVTVVVCDEPAAAGVQILGGAPGTRETDLLNPIWDRISDPIERIFGLLDGYRQMLLHTEFSAGCPIGNLALQLADTHPAARHLHRPTPRRASAG